MVQRGKEQTYHAVPEIMFTFTSVYQINYIEFSAAGFHLYL